MILPQGKGKLIHAEQERLKYILISWYNVLLKLINEQTEGKYAQPYAFKFKPVVLNVW